MGIATLTAAGLVLAGSPAQASPVPRAYKNCTALNGVYPHGVGLPRAKDHVRGHTQPVTTFRRDAKLYRLNTRSDRDGDGVACERR